MTTKEVIALAKEKLGRDVTEQEAQDYIDGKAALPDEALDIVNGGGNCSSQSCPQCASPDVGTGSNGNYVCHACGYSWNYTPIAG